MKPGVKIGSDAHKELFCREFLASHVPYDPKELPWPALDDAGRALLASIPFWGEALGFEITAGPMIQALANVCDDPLVREALVLQAYEETRHGRIIETLLERYDIHALPADIRRPSGDAGAAFVAFGFEECVDSFGAFGVFQLARESALLPESLFGIFDRVIQEEVNHVVFFLNWFAWRQARRGRLQRALRPALSLWYYARAVAKRVSMAVGSRRGEGEGFTVAGGKAFVEGLTLRRVLATCLAENARRLAASDPRLLRPRLVPALAQGVYALVRLLPARSGPPAG